MFLLMAQSYHPLVYRSSSALIQLSETCAGLQVMVLVVLGIVGASAWATLVDIYYPLISSQTGIRQLSATLLALVFSVLVGTQFTEWHSCLASPSISRVGNWS